MKINDVEFNVELRDVLDELQTQLHANGIPLINKIKDVGSDIMITCPYHKDGQERRPSAGLRKSDGTFHCLACGEIHSLPEVISYCFGKNDIVGAWGWTWLLKNFATIEVKERKDVDLDYYRNISRIKDIRKISEKAVRTVDGTVDGRYVSEEELDKYRYIHPYMYERKLTDKIIELFDIGYDSETDCLTFPVRDEDGNTLFVARRSVKTKFFNYPADVEKPLYGIYEYESVRTQALRNLLMMQATPAMLNTLDEVIVCESMLDALTAWVYGKPAVALNGLGSELQFKQLRELSARKLILATDNDVAGMKARKRIRANVKNKLITEYIFPENRKDLNELTKEEFDNLQEVF